MKNSAHILNSWRGRRNHEMKPKLRLQNQKKCNCQFSFELTNGIDDLQECELWGDPSTGESEWVAYDVVEVVCGQCPGGWRVDPPAVEEQQQLHHYRHKHHDLRYQVHVRVRAPRDDLLKQTITAI